MKSIKIHTFNPKNAENEFVVYALCKGLNSGKPLDKPCPNCFVIVCKNQAEKEFYTTLLWGLWKTKYFQQFLVGSVIPFLRIADFRTQINLQAQTVSTKSNAFNSDVQKVKLLEEQQKRYYEQIALINDVKRALIYRHFHSKQ